MIMATTPGQQARYPLGHGTSRSEAGSGGQIGHERLAAGGSGGSREQRRPLTREERRQARRERRHDKARERKKRRGLAAATIWLPALGVAIRDGNVYAWELSWSGPVTGRLLGPLAWAHAEATGGVAGRLGGGNARAAEITYSAGMAGPAGPRAGVSRKGYRGVAAVAFPDGNVWKKEFTDASALIKVKAEAVRFNILAVGAAPETRPAGYGVASDLERLAALHASGILDDEEFRQAKACALGGRR
jgi:Short C-terminal domain